MRRAEARELLRDLVEEVAGELDDEDGAWLLARWRRFDQSLDGEGGGVVVQMNMAGPGPREPEVRIVPVIVRGADGGMRWV